MTVEEFFDLFLIELKENCFLHNYYKFLTKKSDFEFRKAYFIQRLQYITDKIKDKELSIWDCGCGYGTTAIFLAINGFKIYGSTLEFYYEKIPKRLDYWNKYGDMNLLTFSYENMFDSYPPQSSVDVVILQDTLHHLEPINDALNIFQSTLKPKGKLILIEENGHNIIQNAKLFFQRGNKRITEVYDNILQKKIPFGNENIRSLKRWNNIFSEHDFRIVDNETQYIRFYPPFLYNGSNYDKLISSERKLSKKNNLLREYFFFGINFMAEKLTF